LVVGGISIVYPSLRGKNEKEACTTSAPSKAMMTLPKYY